MRTTIEMNPEHRARLLEIAARRGEKGFSGVVAEAIETYLARLDTLDELQARARELRGRLTAEEAEEMRTEIEELRESWR